MVSLVYIVKWQKYWLHSSRLLKSYNCFNGTIKIININRTHIFNNNNKGKIYAELTVLAKI